MQHQLRGKSSGHRLLERLLSARKAMANPITALDAAMTLLLHIVPAQRRASECGRSVSPYDYATILLPCHDLPFERLRWGRAALSATFQTVFVYRGREVCRPYHGYETSGCEAGFSKDCGL